MPKKARHTVRQVEKALLATHGLRAEAARKLKCSPSTITKFIKRHPDLEKTIEEAVEANIDFAESQLFENIKAGKEPSIFFYLKCKAKHRGYVEREQGISIEAFHRAVEQLALVVVANVKDDETLRRIEREWDGLKIS